MVGAATSTTAAGMSSCRSVGRGGGTRGGEGRGALVAEERQSGMRGPRMLLLYS